MSRTGGVSVKVHGFAKTVSVAAGDGDATTSAGDEKDLGVIKEEETGPEASKPARKRASKKPAS